jgi:glycosyltransferase involved in cell wall biosynthesis
LLIGGDGPHRAELEALVDELNLRKRVTFLGYLKGADAVAAYHLAQAFVFASTTETQGLVIGEAMAAGLPVIAVEDHAVEDFVVGGRTGLVTPAFPEALAHAFDEVLGDETQRLVFARAAADRAQCFSIEHETERLELHYERAIELRNRRRRLVGIALHRKRLARLALPRHR